MTPERTAQAIAALSPAETGLANVEYYTTTIATGDWSGSEPATAVKTVSGLLSTDQPLIDVNLSAVTFADVEDKQTEYAKLFRVAATDDDEITFFATETPTEELVIQIKVVR
jgi:type 1 glutamine amidotransferase